MRLKAQRSAIYVAMGLSVLALTGGYALAAISMGQSGGAHQQGSVTTTIGQVAGLSMGSVSLVVMTPTNGPAGSACNAPAGCDVTSGGVSDCAGGLVGSTTCAVGDFVEQVNITTVVGTAIGGVVAITLYVTSGGSPTAGTTFYYTDTTPAASHTITQDFDIGSVPASVSAVTVVAQT